MNLKKNKFMVGLIIGLIAFAILSQQDKKTFGEEAVYLGTTAEVAGTIVGGSAATAAGAGFSWLPLLLIAGGIFLLFAFMDFSWFSLNFTWLIVVIIVIVLIIAIARKR